MNLTRRIIFLRMTLLLVDEPLDELITNVFRQSFFFPRNYY